jgi:hypothetical protein
MHAWECSRLSLTSFSRGVLTCKDWFCYVKPGDWCRTDGYSCHDDCNCCRKDRKRGISAEAGPKVCSLKSNADKYYSCRIVGDGNATCDCGGLPGGPPALTEIVSSTKVDTLAIRPSQCTPGQYRCDPNSKSTLLVCGSNRDWQISADCGTTSSGVGW